MELGDIIQDIMNDTNLDIDFSYEDGLRLSELVGQAQGLQYRIDNYQMFTWGDHGIMFLVGAVISAFIIIGAMFIAVESPWFDELAMRRRLKKDDRLRYITEADRRMGYRYSRIFFFGVCAICVAFTIILGICVGDMLHAHTVMGWRADLADCNGQIEALLAKYGVTI